MTDLSKFKKLSELEHVRARAGIYIGSVYPITKEEWVVENERMLKKNITYSPGILKLFDEVISNSVDAHIRYGKVTEIMVDISSLTGEISIKDDGGIPVQIHPEYNMYIPQMVFGQLRTGSNFDDSDRPTIGQNGLGVKLVNILSDMFIVETCDGVKKFTQSFKNGMSEISEPIISNSAVNGTRITYTPDYTFFKSSLDSNNVLKLIKRVYDVAGCNPNIKVYLNSNRVSLNSFSDYVKLFSDNIVYEEQDGFKIGIMPSINESFDQVSFVNGVDCFSGGTHIDYIMNQICSKLRAYFNKKYKVDVKPNNIKQQMFLVCSLNINAPMFNSQSKELLTSDPKSYGVSYTPTDKFINKLIKSDIVQKILLWIEGEKHKEELAELRKLNKDTSNKNALKKIENFDDATSNERRECILTLTEGNSAALAVLSARDPKYVGVLPLRGKMLNVRDIDIKELAKKKEFQNIMTIVGLKIGTKVESIDQIRYGKICTLTDADTDGYHCAGLIFNMLYTFWPELFDLGVVCRIKPPIIIATYKKNTHEFFSMDEYKTWADAHQGHTHKYFKGLGTYKTQDFKRFLTDKKTYMTKIIIKDESDVDSLNLAFDKKKADERKIWLETI